MGGKTLNLTIEGGESPFVSAGSFTIALAADGNAYSQSAAGAVPAATGAWGHQSAAPIADAVLTLGSYFPDGSSATLSLLDSGLFEMIRSGSNSHQYGHFTISANSGNLPGTPPTILSQPVSKSTGLGTMATFSVAVAETTGVVFQWLKDSRLVAGANLATLTLPAVRAEDAGNYSVVISSLQGAVGSHSATLSIVDGPPVITRQPEPLSVVAGGSATFSVTATGYPAPTGYQWKFGNNTISGATSPAFTRTAVAANHAGPYTCVVSNSIGTTTSSPAFLTVIPQPGGLVSTFPAIEAVPVPQGWVYAFMPVANGKIMVGGSFTHLNYTPRPAMFRINDNGTLDTSFPLKMPVGSSVTRFVPAPDDQMYIVGDYNSYGGVLQQKISRLTAEGNLDLSFESFGNINFIINDLAVQPDRKVVIVGNFTNAKGVARSKIARLNLNGSLDTTFNKDGKLISDDINRVVIGADGRIFIAGKFTTVHDQPRSRIAALTSTGTLDTGFDPGAGFDGEIRDLQFQPDGKLLVAGNQLTYNGRGSRCLTRLFTDGTQDLSFVPAALTAPAAAGVYAMAIQKNGKIVVGGNFAKVNDTARSCITRLLPDGAADPSFNPGVGTGGTAPLVHGLAIAEFGDILVGGAFTAIGGVAHEKLARLKGDPLTLRIPSIVTQPSSKAAHAGDQVTLTVLADGSPLSFQWQKNGVDLTGQVYPGLTLKSAAAADAASYQVRVFNAYGSVTSAPAVVTVNPSRVPGSIDPSFAPTASVTPVNAVMPLADGRMLVGGGFSNALTTGLVRVNPDGTRDPGFTTKVAGTIYAFARQPDGKILIAGGFDRVNTTNRAAVARLNADGTLDTSFNYSSNNTTIYSLAVQPDGRILIGGYASGAFLRRLEADGGNDGTFNLTNPPNQPVGGILLQGDGKILATGAFTSIAGVARPGVTRLNPNGGNDSSFVTTSAGLGFTPNGVIAMQSGGRLLMGAIDGKLYRLDSFGLVDVFFTYTRPDTQHEVFKLMVQEDDRIVLVRYYNAPTDGNPQYRLNRLNANGTVDAAFVSEPGGNGSIYALERMVNGKIAVGGAFTALNTKARPGLALLEAESAFAPVFQLQPANQRALSGSIVTFAASASGTPAPTYQWRRDGVDLAGATGTSLIINPVLPSAAATYTVVATNTLGTATSNPAILVIGRLPVIRTQPASVAPAPNSNVTFSVAAESSVMPISYQWRFNGQPVTGATAPSLVLGNVTAANAGNYDVLVKNLDGEVASNVATLTLQVPGGTTFADFITANGLDPVTNGAPGADPDGDGLSNLFEYIAGGNPKMDEGRAAPVVKLTPREDLPPFFTYEFDRRKDHQARGIVIETSAGLGTWQQAVDGVDGVSISAVSLDATTEHVTVGFSVSAARRFIHLAVR